MKTVLFVGFGNMGSIFAKKFVQNENFEVFAIDPNVQQKNERVEFFESFEDMPSSIYPNIIVFAVKPQNIDEIINKYKIFTDALFISILAGKPISYFEEKIPHAKIIRVMPNLGLKYDSGVNICMENQKCLNSDKNLLDDIFEDQNIWIEKEDLFHITTAISGSGIAFVLKIMEAFIGNGINKNIPEEDSYKMTLSIFESAVRFLKDEYKIEEVVEKITSKNGTTEAGLNYMSNKMYKLIKEIIEASEKRSKELAL